MLNTYFHTGTFIFLLFLLAGCERDLPITPAGNASSSTAPNFELVLLGKTGSQDLVLRQPFEMPDGSRIRLDELKMYISEIELQNTQGNWISVKDYLLADFSRSHIAAKTLHGKGERFGLKVPAGRYQNLKFCIGLPYEINRTDPTPLQASDPLSLYQGMYWDWNSGYRFFLMEGMLDTSTNGNGIPDHYLAYHLGLDTLYFCKEMEFPVMNLTTPVGSGDVIPALDLELDILKIFYGISDTIRPATESITHTSGSFPLALRMQQNLKNAWRAIPE